MHKQYFLETIRVQDESLPFLEWHQRRFNSTFLAHNSVQKPPRLLDILTPFLLAQVLAGRWKLRLEYVCYPSFEYSVSIQEYTPLPVSRFKITGLPTQDYIYKYSDRSRLGPLHHTDGSLFLWTKDKHLIEAPYANIVVQFGKTYLTPLAPLHLGTCRARLLSEGKIVEDNIRIESLKEADSIMLINAMLDWEEIRVLPPFL